MNKVTKIVVLSLVIVLPLFFILFLKKGNFSSTYTLPYMGNHYYDTELNDSVYHTIPPFLLTDQLGDTITIDSFKNDVIIANFFFASCPTICPNMNKNVALAYDRFLNSPNIKFLTITTDPDHDTTEVLWKYSRLLSAQAKKWYFARHDSQKYILNLSTEFLVKTSDSTSDFLHDPVLVLIDQQNHIRGLYDGMDINEVNRLKEDIKLLFGNEKK